jgi:hypothetical protein
MTPQPETTPIKHYHWTRIIKRPNGSDRQYVVYYDVWIEPDGSLHNPFNHQPEELVRTAVLEADAKKTERMANAAKQAVATRKRRREARIHEAAKRYLSERGVGKQTHCYCCHRVLTDPESIDRGIGPECWEHVLYHVTRIKAEAEGGSHAAA